MIGEGDGIEFEGNGQVIEATLAFYGLSVEYKVITMAFIHTRSPWQVEQGTTFVGVLSFHPPDIAMFTCISAPKDFLGRTRTRTGFL